MLRFPARTQSPKTLCDTLKPTQIQAHLGFPTTKTQRQKPKELEFYQRSKNETKKLAELNLLIKFVIY